MKIEKKKYTTTNKWSKATAKSLAAMLGIATATALSACNDDSSNPAGPSDPAEPASSEDSIEPDNGNKQTTDQKNVANSSSSGQVEVDIPKSSEAVDMGLPTSNSSETTAEPIDSEPLTDDAVEEPKPQSSSSMDILPFSSSIEPLGGFLPPDYYSDFPPVINSSSSSSDGTNVNPIDIEPLAGDVVVEPGTIDTPESSSSSEKLDNGECKTDPVSNIIICPATNPENSETPNIDPGNMIVSMVTTFESIDIDV